MSLLSHFDLPLIGPPPQLSSQLASYKLPRATVRVEALPPPTLGEVQKHLLPAWSLAA